MTMESTVQVADTSILGDEETGGDQELAALLARIHEIGPLLRENAIIADKERRMPDSSIEAIESTGAFAISTMAQYGGYDQGSRWLFEAARTLSYYCPASGWLTVISNGSVMLLSRWPKSALERIYADGHPLRMASVFVSPHGSAVRDGDEYVIDGEWPFSSNIAHSEWAICILPVFESEGQSPELGFVVLKRGDYTVKDTWFTIGMRGTGSNTMVVEKVRVPADQVILGSRLLGVDFEADPDTAFAQRLAPVSTMGTTITAPSLGAAQAALEYTVSKSRSRPVTYSIYEKQIESGAWVKDIGHAAGKIDGAMLHLRRSADLIDAYAAGTTPMPMELRKRIRGDIGSATYNLADSLNDLVWLHGTAAFAESSTLGRLWRDVNTGVRHATVSAPFNFEISGTGVTGSGDITDLT